jgi:hypothetical protein
VKSPKETRGNHKLLQVCFSKLIHQEEGNECPGFHSSETPEAGADK